jgi:hypothetical protein
MPRQVYTVRMLESCASLLIQMVDVLLGAVMHDLLCRKVPGKGTDPCKRAVAGHVRHHLGWTTLAAVAIQTAPRCFSVLRLGGRA